MEQSSKEKFQPECPLAHDLVNRLCALIGHCDLALEKTQEDSPALKHMLLIRNIAGVMAKELNQFQCDLINLRNSNSKKVSA
jgi:hypothetical protein